MPEISVWPVSSLVRTWKVGSSSARRASAVDIFSWSIFVFGSIATLITGSGNVDRLELDRLVGRGERVAGDDLLDPDARRRCRRRRPRRAPRARWRASSGCGRSARSGRCVTLSTREPAASLPE